MTSSTRASSRRDMQRGGTGSEFTGRKFEQGSDRVARGDFVNELICSGLSSALQKLLGERAADRRGVGRGRGRKLRSLNHRVPVPAPAGGGDRPCSFRAAQCSARGSRSCHSEQCRFPLLPHPASLPSCSFLLPVSCSCGCRAESARRCQAEPNAREVGVDVLVRVEMAREGCSGLLGAGHDLAQR